MFQLVPTASVSASAVIFALLDTQTYFTVTVGSQSYAIYEATDAGFPSLVELSLY